MIRLELLLNPRDNYISIAQVQLMLLQHARIFDMTKKTNEAASGRFDYDALNIGAQSKKALEATAFNIQALGRRSTEQAFELGDLLEQASELVEPGTFEKWVRGAGPAVDVRAPHFPRRLGLVSAVAGDAPRLLHCLGSRHVADRLGNHQRRDRMASAAPGASCEGSTDRRPRFAE